jgi:hypothetical protein
MLSGASGPHRGFTRVNLLRFIAGGTILIGALPAAWRLPISFNRIRWELFQNEASSETEARRSEEYSRKLPLVTECTLGKDQAVFDLLDDRISLLKAAALFKHFDDCLFDLALGARPILSKSADEEYLAEVIRWAEKHMRDFPESRHEALRQRLKQELAALAARPEGIQLPAVGESIGVNVLGVAETP